MSSKTKTELAREHFARGDFSDVHDVLNKARKVAVYEGDEPDLGDQSLEDVAADVELAVDLAEREASP